MAKGQVTKRRPVYPKNVEDLAEKCGLVASYRCVNGIWEWFIETRNGSPCYQGDAAKAKLWLQGYQRCVEHQKTTHDRLTAELARKDVEIRRNDDGSLDEIVGRSVFVHLEQLDVDRWFLDIGGVRLDLFHPRGGHVKAVIFDPPEEVTP
jgi:hypothetical protein